MGRKGKWFSSVKKALSPDSKEKKEQKSKKKWFGKQHQLYSDSTSIENARDLSPPLPPPQPEEVKTIETTNEQNVHAAYSVPVAAAAAEPVLPPEETTMEVVRVVKVNKFAGKSGEEMAAIKIQTAFKGYLARRALRALRGLGRLKSLMEGPTIKRQATHTLRCMQTLARVQSQIHSRRIRMSEENQALQRQLLQKHAQELEKLRMGEEWDDSLQSKEQIEANLLNKYEAAMRRERALAYSFTHQQTWKNSSRSANPMFMSSSNPTWGWSWLERWMAAHPWEKGGMTEKELSNDHSSVKTASRSMVGGEISKSYARYQLNSDKLSPAESEKVRQTMSPRSPLTPSKPGSSTIARKLKSASPRSSIGGADDDNRSIISMQSDRYRRHSIAGSSVRDDESLGSSSAVPSYMVPTESARAKSRLQSPLGVDKNGTSEKEKGPLGPAKKRLSYPPSPARPRRQLGPRKMESNLNAEIAVANGQG
ncbi:protein IQ-DOMAIN 2 [Ricinus communis]|uniref:protein IQ-DOMAIN 2 n=1 Tax=Ricinus communis TaxID=3988 RepID=UPI00201B31A5|nr:protein IQ-DOMAIN 2 [Ricinus communis]XP_048225584.1 protein IQ-DOMAIN 2 [Ricinus communis]XP_048225585.1 protein IQ-DOMAIN 2 [Ricinus communis]